MSEEEKQMYRLNNNEENAEDKEDAVVLGEEGVDQVAAAMASSSPPAAAASPPAAAAAAAATTTAATTAATTTFDDALYLHHKNQMILDLATRISSSSTVDNVDSKIDVDNRIDVYPKQNAKSRSSILKIYQKEKEKEKEENVNANNVNNVNNDNNDNNNNNSRGVSQPVVEVPPATIADCLMIDEAMTRSSALRNQNQMILDLTFAADDSTRDTASTEFRGGGGLGRRHRRSDHTNGTTTNSSISTTDDKKAFVAVAAATNNDDNDLLKLPVVSDEMNIYNGITSANNKNTKKQNKKPTITELKNQELTAATIGNTTRLLPGAYSEAPGVPTVSRYINPDLTTSSRSLYEKAVTDDNSSFLRRRRPGGGGRGREGEDTGDDDNEDIHQESSVTGTTVSSTPDDTYSVTAVAADEQGIYSHNTPPPAAADADDDGTTTIVEAFRVSETTIEQNVRQRIIEESIRANVVLEEHEEEEEEHNNNNNKQARASFNNNNKKWILLLGLLLAATIVIAILVVSMNGGKDNESVLSDDGKISNNNTTTLPPTIILETPPPQPSPSPTSTIEEVLKRGKVRCGAYDEFPGFSFKDKDGNFTGLNFQLCRAVAAAVFDNAEQYEIVVVNTVNRFQKLSSHDIDLISQTVTLTMDRDVSELFTSKGYTFSYPFYFSGIRFGGLPDYVKCADNLDPFTGICRGLQVCVPAGTTQETFVKELLPGPKVVPFSSTLQSLEYMNDGSCNTIAAAAVVMNPDVLRQAGLSPNITFELGNNLFSRDPLALVTRDGDTQWSDLVNSIIKIIYTAEAMNITSSNVHTYDFGGGEGEIHDDLKARIIQVVSTIGNYHELTTGTEWWDEILRSDTNRLNQDFNTGLMYSYPFGTIDRSRSDTTSLLFLEEIQARGYFVCGINDAVTAISEEGYDYRSMDMEFCRLISAALFVGNTNRVVFKNVTEVNGFQELADGSVDVLAGQQMSLSNEFFEPTTGHAYSFSPPYFYHTDGTILGLATRRGDELWSSFVYWIIASVVYAEERNITSTEAIEMPVVNLFGENYTQSFRDCIAGVGNYGEIYNRTMESMLPRSGGNLLNKAPFGPQQVAYPLL